MRAVTYSEILRQISSVLQSYFEICDIYIVIKNFRVYVRVFFFYVELFMRNFCDMKEHLTISRFARKSPLVAGEEDVPRTPANDENKNCRRTAIVEL